MLYTQAVRRHGRVRLSGRSFWLCLLAACVFVLTVQAKRGQYEPDGTLTRHLAKATKLDQSRLGKTVAVEPARILLPRPDDFGAPPVLVVAEASGVPRFDFVGPVVSRPPPAGC